MAEQSLTQTPLQTKPINNGSNHPVHKTLASAANLANLLPTGTVLAFQALTPSFSNNGCCQLSNKCLTASMIIICSICCFLSSFTDSFIDNKDGKLFYGIATFKGLYIFNSSNNINHNCDDEEMKDYLDKFKIRFIDFVHAFASLIVFLVFALSNSNVETCFFSEGGGFDNGLVINLPLGAGVLSSFLFTLFPTTRRGIGYGDTTCIS